MGPQHHLTSRRWSSMWVHAVSALLVVSLGGALCSCAVLSAATDTYRSSPTARSAVRPTITPATLQNEPHKDAQRAAVAVPGAQLPPTTPTFVPTHQPQRAPQEGDVWTPDRQSASTSVAPPSAGPLELSENMQVEVIYAGADGLNLRDAPNGAVLAALLKGSVLTIRGPARDVQGFRWWPVEVAPGWMADGPADTRQPRWLAPLSGTSLASGQQVHVMYPGGEGVNLRQAPDPGSATIGALGQGSILRLGDASQTVNGVRWWPVHLAAGWVAEGAMDPSQPRWLHIVGG